MPWSSLSIAYKSLVCFQYRTYCYLHRISTKTSLIMLSNSRSHWCSCLTRIEQERRSQFINRLAGNESINALITICNGSLNIWCKNFKNYTKLESVALFIQRSEEINDWSEQNISFSKEFKHEKVKCTYQCTIKAIVGKLFEQSLYTFHKFLWHLSQTANV